MLLLLLQTLVVLLGIILYYERSRRRALNGLPPGPKPLPIVGNIMDLPPKGMPEYEHWIKFKDTYGPVSSVTVLGTTMVMLHSEEAVTELLTKTSLKTSGRPSWYFADEMCAFGGMTPFLPFNLIHRLHRKLLHQQMGTRKLVEKFYDFQDLESRRFLLRVLDTPTNLIQHIKT